MIAQSMCILIYEWVLFCGSCRSAACGGSIDKTLIFSDKIEQFPRALVAVSIVPEIKKRKISEAEFIYLLSKCQCIH